MLSLVSGTKIRVCMVGSDKTCLETVDNIASIGQAYVYDWYGEKCYIDVREGGMEPIYLLMALSGEPVFVGESHELLHRKHKTARYVRQSIHTLTKPVFVRLPQRKVVLDDNGPFDTLQSDEKSVHLVPQTASGLLPLMETAATAGISVHRDKTSLRIDLEKNRPVCFATKAINGNFETNLEGTLEELTSSAILTPYGAFDSKLLEKVNRTNIIFEGSTLYNDVLTVPARAVEKTRPVYHINLIEPTVPVELTWFAT